MSEHRSTLIWVAALVVATLLGYFVGGSAPEVECESAALLQELESAAYQPRSLALEEALQKTRAYLQEHQ